MSLPAAARGEKDHLRPLWEGEFDFERACREVGRNDAFWVLCYRRQLAGLDLPGARERRRLCLVANRATGYRDQQGRRERYTGYEARTTVEQVSGYARRRGVVPAVARLRRLAETSRSSRVTPPLRRLALAYAGVAELSSSTTFTASTRQLAAAAGMSPVAVSCHRHALEALGWVRRVGECAPRGGHQRGTSIWSLIPARPEQRIDEAEPPSYDHRLGRWVWRDPSRRGTLTRWAFYRMRESVPNVRSSSPTTGIDCSKGPNNPFLESIQRELERGSP